MPTALPVKLIVLLAVLLTFSISACWLSHPAITTAFSVRTVNIGSPAVYRLAKCGWYSPERALLAFWRLGDDQRMSLDVCDIESGHLTELHNSPYAIAWEDDLLVSSEELGYQSALRTVTFARTDLSPKAREPVDSTTLVLSSDDLKWSAEIAEGSLRLTGATSGRPVRYPVQSNPTLRWSDAGNLAAFVSNDGMTVYLLELDRAEVRTMRAGTDFTAPEGLVQVMYCWLLGDDYLLLETAGEESDPLILVKLDSQDGSYVLGGEGESTVLCCSGDQVLYCEKARTAGPARLLAYDYRAGATTLLCEVDAEIMCASFSPDRQQVMIGIYSSAYGNRLLVLDR